MPTRRLLVVGLAGIACAGLLTALLWPAGPGVTRWNFHRVQLGMPQAEVEAVLGTPNPIAPDGKVWAYEG
jgi:hypothetical protein